MRYSIVVSYFVLWRASWLPVTRCFRTKIEGVSKDLILSNRDDKDSAMVDRRPYKTNKRARRSTLTRFINDIASVVETFHVKPQLAGVLNDVNNGGQQFKNGFHETPKSVYAMLSKGTGKVVKKAEVGNNPKVLKKRDKQILKFEEEVESLIKGPYVDNIGLTKKELEFEEIAIKGILKENKGTNHLNKLPFSEYQMRSMAKELTNIENEQQGTAFDETKLVEDLLSKNKNLLDKLRLKNSNDRTIENIVGDILRVKPELKQSMGIEMDRLKTWHKEIQKRVDILYNKMKKHRKSHERIKELYDRLIVVKTSNEQWIKSIVGNPNKTSTTSR